MLMAEHLISAKSALDLAEYRSTDTDPELPAVKVNMKLL